MPLVESSHSGNRTHSAQEHGAGAA